MDIDQLKAAIDAEDAARLREYFQTLAPADAPLVVSRLSRDEQTQLFAILPSDEAAWLLRPLPTALAVLILDALPAEQAAAILNGLPSDEQTDLLAELDEPEAEAILERMAAAEVADVELLRDYPADTAGGLMLKEYLTFSQTSRVAEVVDQLRSQASQFARYPVQYVYVVSEQQELVGVLQLRDLLFLGEEEPLTAAVLRKPLTLPVTASLQDVRKFFNHHGFLAVPITDEKHRLLGVVTRGAVERAAVEQAETTLLRFSGIIAGEEFRTMPFGTRSARRLAWLGVTILLNLMAASVVGWFEDTLSAVIALAVFLPVISGMSGSAGNQAIAVTMRELALGLIHPGELRWVATKEAVLACVNGLVLGLSLGLAAWLWKGNFQLGLLVGFAQAVSIFFAACFGGILPLILKRLKIDPALASAPILTTLTDSFGFLVTLGLASQLVPWLQ